MNLYKFGYSIAGQYMVPLFALALALDDILIVFRAQQIQISMAISSSFPLSPSLVVLCKDNPTPVHTAPCGFSQNEVKCKKFFCIHLMRHYQPLQLQKLQKPGAARDFELFLKRCKKNCQVSYIQSAFLIISNQDIDF